MNYSLETIKQRVTQVLQKEAQGFTVNEEEFKKSLRILRGVIDEILNDAPEETPVTVTFDLDIKIMESLRLNKMYDKVKESQRLPVNYFIEQGFHEVVHCEPDYYKLRGELLAHSKILFEDTTIDYLKVVLPDDVP